MAEFRYPYKSGFMEVTSKYGERILDGKKDNHKGVDLQGTDKTLVAPCDGVIGTSTIITDTSNLTWQWGNYVRIDCDNGLQVFMCHMNKRLVAKGQRVKAGDVVGIEGNTGFSFGSHVHFEVRRNGTSIDPTPLLGIKNAWGRYRVPEIDTPDYASLVCKKCGLEAQTKAYLNKYKYAEDLWRKLWAAME